MPLNLIKTYSNLLDLEQFTEKERTISLLGVFNQDIKENTLKFNNKLVRPIKTENPEIDILFTHLTCEKNIDGARVFDMQRSKRQMC